jgi:DNA polymerase
MYFSPRVIDTGDGYQLDYLMPKHGGLERTQTYGGNLVENISQSLARDVMANAMGPAEDAGFEILLLVHDELVSMVDVDSDLNHKVLCAIMANAPDWVAGLPLEADGYDAVRYKK